MTNNGKTVTWEAICAANYLADCGSLTVGDVLLIPCNGCGTFVQSRVTRQELGGDSAVEVVTKTRCVYDANNPNPAGFEATTTGTGTEEASGKSDTPTALIVVVCIISLITLLLTVTLIIRERSSRDSLGQKISLLQSHHRRRSSAGSEANLPTLPVAPVVKKSSSLNFSKEAWRV